VPSQLRSTLSSTMRKDSGQAPDVGELPRQMRQRVKLPGFAGGSSKGRRVDANGARHLGLPMDMKETFCQQRNDCSVTGGFAVHLRSTALVTCVLDTYAQTGNKAQSQPKAPKP